MRWLPRRSQFGYRIVSIRPQVKSANSVAPNLPDSMLRPPSYQLSGLSSISYSSSPRKHDCRNSMLVLYLLFYVPFEQWSPKTAVSSSKRGTEIFSYWRCLAVGRGPLAPALRRRLCDRIYFSFGTIEVVRRLASWPTSGAPATKWS